MHTAAVATDLRCLIVVGGWGEDPVEKVVLGCLVEFCVEAEGCADAVLADVARDAEAGFCIAGDGRDDAAWMGSGV